MEMIAFRLGGMPFSVIASQVERIDELGPSADYPIISLTSLFGLSDERQCLRAFIGSTPTGEKAAVRVPVQLESFNPRADTVYRVPRALVRLGSPSWLAGFVVRANEFAAVLDLPWLLQCGQRGANP